MAIIDPLFSILDYCECNRLVSKIFLSGLPTVVLLLLACSETENVSLGARKNNFGLDYDAT
jgi:hypothetical protein